MDHNRTGFSAAGEDLVHEHRADKYRPADIKPLCISCMPAYHHSMTNHPTMTVPEAAGVFGFSGGASLNEIHARYRELAKEWHPDVSQHEAGLSHETFIRIKVAYDLLVDYCLNYEISFRPDDIRNGTGYDSREFWMSRFGDDPIWG